MLTKKELKKKYRGQNKRINTRAIRFANLLIKRAKEEGIETDKELMVKAGYSPNTNPHDIKSRDTFKELLNDAFPETFERDKLRELLGAENITETFNKEGELVKTVKANNPAIQLKALELVQEIKGRKKPKEQVNNIFILENTLRKIANGDTKEIHEGELVTDEGTG